MRFKKNWTVSEILHAESNDLVKTISGESSLIMSQTTQLVEGLN